MLANEYEERACTNKNTQGTLHMDHVKEVNVNVDDWDILYDDLVDLMLNFTYGELVSITEKIAHIIVLTSIADHRTNRHAVGCTGCHL